MSSLPRSQRHWMEDQCGQRLFKMSQKLHRVRAGWKRIKGSLRRVKLCTTSHSRYDSAFCTKVLRSFRYKGHEDPGLDTGHREAEPMKSYHGPWFLQLPSHRFPDLQKRVWSVHRWVWSVLGSSPVWPHFLPRVGSRIHFWWRFLRVECKI